MRIRKGFLAYVGAIASFALLLGVTMARSQTENYSAVLTLDNATARKIAVGGWCVGNASHDACTSASADVTTNDLYITPEVNAIRWWADGSVPTASSGHLLQVGTALVLHGHSNVVRWTAISTAAGGSTVYVSVGRP